MSKLEKQKDKAKALETKDPKGAIEAWLEVLKAQDDADGEANPDLSIFNRVGDLYLKVKDPAQAADYYDRAVDKYAELGFYNNAIAMCNKVLRNAPGRQTTYLKLAKLYAAKGFMAEAKQNFVEYAERMQKQGKIQQAFSALKEFTDISPESAHLREMLEEHLRMYGDPGRRTSAVATPASKPEPKDDVSKSGKRKTSSLVFLDVDAPPAPKAKPGGRVTPPPLSPASPPSPPSPPPRSRVAASGPVVEGLIEQLTPEPDTSLEIESTSLVEGLEPTGGGTLEGFETTSAEFGDVRLDPGDVTSLREDVTADDVAPLAELEPTVPADAGPAGGEPGAELEFEPLLDDEIEIEAPGAPPAPVSPAAAPRARFTFPKVAPAKAPAPRVAPVVPTRPTAPGRPGVGSPPRVTVPKMPAPRVEPPKVKPVVPRRPDAPPAGAPPRRKTVVEVPPLELEPDFETADGETGEGHEIDDAPLVTDEPPGAGRGRGRGGRRSGSIDLDLGEAAGRGADRESLVFGGIDAAAAPPTIEELEARVADDPDDPEGHQALGEALIEEGERARGIEELDHATTGFENLGNLQQARDLVDEILRLDPNSVRHRQKQVEFAFKSGDKAKLIDAYLELADALLRSDLPDKARAVYQRVAEHDPHNERAKAALGMLAPVSAPPPQPKVKARAGDAEGKTAPKDAKMKVRDEAVADDTEFVDLGAMILEEDLPERDTRMKIADEEPTGDEEKDFQGMLARFKQGIDENIDEADFQSHYDLGIAFKEMGLLDEAIAELQKALRAPEGKLRSSEALGVCFIEKGGYGVAESILRRALDLPATGDQERLGILYWLGRALEAQGKKADARELYGRVFAVDIRFMDVGERAKALARAK
jgi:tetratricopeptide (TPR) repeat protein